MQYVYFEGCPCVEASPGPGTAPAICNKTSRIALPTVAFALLPGPNTPKPELKPSSSTTLP